MFSICESMKWTHLPVAGGIYDQDPDLLAGFQIIFAARAKHEEAEAEKRERDARRRSGSSKLAGRRR